MASLLPTFNISPTSYNVSINGLVYFIRTYWNEYASMWFLDLQDSNSEPIAMGLALVPNINLLRFSETLTNTFGELRVVDLTGEGNALNTSLGQSALLYFFNPGEFEATFPDYNVQLYRTQQFVFSDLFEVAP